MPVIPKKKTERKIISTKIIPTKTVSQFRRVAAFKVAEAQAEKKYQVELKKAEGEARREAYVEVIPQLGTLKQDRWAWVLEQAKFYGLSAANKAADIASRYQAREEYSRSGDSGESFARKIHLMDRDIDQKERSYSNLLNRMEQRSDRLEKFGIVVPKIESGLPQQKGGFWGSGPPPLKKQLPSGLTERQRRRYFTQLSVGQKMYALSKEEEAKRKGGMLYIPLTEEDYKRKQLSLSNTWLSTDPTKSYFGETVGMFDGKIGVAGFPKDRTMDKIFGKDIMKKIY